MEKSFTKLCTKILRTSEGLRKVKYYASSGFLLVLLQFFSFAVSAQEKILSGTVIDVGGEALPGVSVIVKNTKSGTVTSAQGKFSINVPSGTANPVLVLSYIGFTTQEVVVGSQTTFNVTLQGLDNDLSEVVVVGYGTQKKETLTGSIAKVDAKAFQDKGALASPLQALQGQVPGAIFTRSSGAPGDEAWSVNVRGAISAKTAEPLLIIDGVAYDSFRELRLLNPSDIDNISFLKDGSAAIYGSRAAGGVMLVTTKKAKAGKASVEFNTVYSRKETGLQPRLMSMDEWAAGVLDARTNDGFGSDDVWVRYAKLALANKGGYIDARDLANPPIPGAFLDVKDFVFLDNNWSDILWGGANSTQNDLSVSGRGDKSGYRLSLGYMNEGGTLQYGNNNNKRYNLRLNNDFQVSDRFSIESVISYSQQNQVSPSMIGNVLGQGYPQPGFPAATLTGKPYAWGGQYTPNWFAELGGDNELKVGSTNISETLRYKIMDGLQLVSNLGYNTSTAVRDVQQNNIQWFNYEGDLLIQNNPTQANSYYQKSTAKTDFYSASAYLQYNKQIKTAHNLGLTLGGQYEFKDYDYYLAKITDINSSLEALNGTGVVTADKDRYQYAMGSYFGRVNYDYKSKYLFEANGRYDGSSKFDRQNRWNFFYGLSAGWRLSEEKFVKDLGIFNELKLRASYGIVGNQLGVDNYDGQQLYNQLTASGPYLGGGKTSYITTNGRLVSYDRTWERVNNYNLAIDFALLNNRLSGTVERFIKKNNNMFLEQQYSSVLGATAPQANIGKFKSNGWDAILNWSDKVGNVTYNIGGVLTFAETKILDFGGQNLITQGGFIANLESYPLNSIFGLEYNGRIQTEGHRQEYLNAYNAGNGIGLSSAVRVGDNMYKDVNGDGVLNFDDLVYLGTDNPKISYSFNAGAGYKGFDFSVVFQGAAQRTTFRDDVNWRQPFRSVYLNTTNQSVNNHWTTENPNAHFPKYSTNGEVNNYNYQASSWSVENGAYLRLKNVVLGYTLPESVLGSIKAFSRLRVYIAGQDLWETTKINDGWDPEATRKVSANERYPFSRSFTAGINATF